MLPYPNGKKFCRSNVKKVSHLQIDIFGHFDFCRDRRNAILLHSIFIIHTVSLQPCMGLTLEARNPTTVFSLHTVNFTPSSKTQAKPKREIMESNEL